MPILPKEIVHEFQENRKRGITDANSLQLTQFKNLLLVCLTYFRRHFKKTCIIVDGLDECEERQDILQVLSPLCHNGPSNLPILARSRPEPDIAAALQQFQPLKIRPSDTKSGLLRYISTGIRSIPELDEHRASMAISILSKKVSGMFIWVRLVINLLKEAATPSEFEDVLAKIPRRLHQIYCLAIERLDRRLASAPPSRRNVVKNILCWLALAPNPISMKEMEEALAFSALDSPPGAVWDGVKGKWCH
ncbi:hypothetical protein F5Y11DRAFT_192754 [Daldinia sp. FL1419]|nr:hypothetical protein F5Y11DRAFT_192754 [Daldinia sp. FL1419]